MYSSVINGISLNITVIKYNLMQGIEINDDVYLAYRHV